MRTQNPLRVALYSHDTMGLGHFRRNLLIAQSIQQARIGADVLLITGFHGAGVLGPRQDIDCLTLPSLKKDGDGQYRSRCLSLDTKELTRLRAQVIKGALGVFDPHVFIVDNVPRGLMGELESSLEMLRTRGNSRCVLGLRDILDDPRAVQFEWQSRGNHEAVAEYYDAVWVYGDRRFYDPSREYGFPLETAARLSFTGYFDRRAAYIRETAGGHARPTVAQLGLPPGRLVLCLVGGGQDGASLAQVFSRITLPSDTNAIIVAGPYMPTDARAEISGRIGNHPRWRLLEFHHDPTVLLAEADAVVAMAGYNTVGEILSYEKTSLIVPRVAPRREQQIRAERLAANQFAAISHPKTLTPQKIQDWLANQLNCPSISARAKLDFDGLRRIPQMVLDLCGYCALEGLA